jgi:hypothetical protein
MRYIWSFIVLFSIASGDKINLAHWDKKVLSQFLLYNQTKNNSVKVRNITEKFLNTPYKAHTMIGSTAQKEELVIDLGHLDCFTFIDYVEAMKHSRDFNEFKTNLIMLRYQSGTIDYTFRNHFLSDWILYNGFENITSSLSPRTKQAIKTLNLSGKNKLFLKGIKTKKIKINYIDSKDLTKEIVNKLRTGDYIGIYTPIEGLDVTHVGIFIKKEGKAYLRHASSKKQFLKVVDEPFESYIKNTPGFIALRKKAKKKMGEKD